MKKDKLNEKVRVELIVHGNVQVVSYRYRVLDIADELGIVGKIWSLSDKTVGINAEGEKAKIQKFIERIKIRPLSKKEVMELQDKGEFIPPQPLAKVERVSGENKFLPYTGKYKKFEAIADDHDKELLNSLRTASQLIDRLRTDMYHNFQVLSKNYRRTENNINANPEKEAMLSVKSRIIELENGHATGFMIDLGNAPLVIVKAKKGYIMSSHLDVNTANKKGDIAGKVIGVKSIEEALDAEIVEITENAKRADLMRGMTGKNFLNRLM